MSVGSAGRVAEPASEVVIRSGGKRVVVRVKAGSDAAALRRSVEIGLAVGARLDLAAARLQITVDDVIAYVDSLGFATPTGAAAPGSGLTQAEEDVLREVGALQADLPPLGDRPSAVSADALRRMLADALSAKQAALMLALTPGRIRQMIADRTVLAVRGQGGWKLPQFQFASEDGARLIRGLDKVLPELPEDVHPLVVQAFMNRAHPDLGIDGEPRTPRDWLEGGGSIEKVVELARDLHRLP